MPVDSKIAQMNNYINCVRCIQRIEEKVMVAGYNRIARA